MALAHVDARTHTSKALEVPIEMRLIVIATRQRQLRPISAHSFTCAPQCGEEAAHPAELLGREADLLTKYLNKPRMAQRNLMCHLCDGVRLWDGHEGLQAEGYLWTPLQGTDGVRQQRLFEQTELRLGRGVARSWSSTSAA